MKLTYDPTAKAESLARFLGALREEAAYLETIDSPPSRKAHLKVVYAEIAYLEIVEAEWRERQEQKARLLAHFKKTKIDPDLEVYDSTIWHLGPENEKPLASKQKAESLQPEPEERAQGITPEILESESGIKAQEIVDRAKEEREG